MPNASERSKEPLNESQLPITMDQITTIVSAIVENKMATVANTPLQQAGLLTVEATVDFCDQNFVQQPLATPLSNPGDIAAHVNEKTWKAILQDEYIDFVSLLHKNFNTSSTIHDLLTIMANGESLPISFPSQRRAKKVSIDCFDQWLSAFSFFFHHPVICLSALGSGNVHIPQHHPVLRSLLARI